MWKDIPNYKGQYQINENGDVRSVEREVVDSLGHKYILPNKLLKPNKTKNGYYIIHLCKNGIRKAFYVHKLVAKLFLPNIYNCSVVNHLDGNKLNCNVDNLEWTTYSKNNQHAYDTGLKQKGEGQYNAKLTIEQVKEIRRNGKNSTFQKIADLYGVSKATIRDVLLNKTWKDIT